MVDELDSRFYNYLLAHQVKRNIAISAERFEYGWVKELHWLIETHLAEKDAFVQLVDVHRVLIQSRLFIMMALSDELKAIDLDIWDKRNLLLDLMVLETEVESLLDVYGETEISL